MGYWSRSAPPPPDTGTILGGKVTHAAFVERLARALVEAFPDAKSPAEIPEPDRSRIELAIIDEIQADYMARSGPEMAGLAVLAAFEPDVEH